MITIILEIAPKENRALLWALYLATLCNDGLPVTESLVEDFYNRFATLVWTYSFRSSFQGKYSNFGQILPIYENDMHN